MFFFIVSDLYWLDVFGCSSEKHMERSVRIYRIALERCKHCPRSNMAAVIRHLAAALNEYGIFLMRSAEQKMEEGKYCFERSTIMLEEHCIQSIFIAASSAETLESAKETIVKSSQVFGECIEHFHVLDDDSGEILARLNKARVSLLCCNNFKLFVANPDSEELHPAERQFLVKVNNTHATNLSLYFIATVTVMAFLYTFYNNCACVLNIF